MLDELLRDTFDSPAKKRPPLGKPPAHLFKPTSTLVTTAGAFLRRKNAVENQRPFIQASFDAYLDDFLSSMEDFRIATTPENRETFDEVVCDAIERMRPYRDNFVDCVLYMLQFAPGEQTERSLITFLENLIPYQSRPEGCDRWNELDYDNYLFFIYELSLYLIAACIRSRQYGTAASIIESEYHLTRTLKAATSTSAPRPSATSMSRRLTT